MQMSCWQYYLWQLRGNELQLKDKTFTVVNILFQLIETKVFIYYYNKNKFEEIIIIQCDVLSTE